MLDLRASPTSASVILYRSSTASPTTAGTTRPSAENNFIPLYSAGL